MGKFGNIVQEGLLKMKDQIVRKSQEAGQEVTGKTYRNITVTVSEQDGVVHGYVDAPVYFHTLMRGRGPAKVPANMAEIIMEWARAKGLHFDTPKDLVRFANGVAWNMRLHGSKMFRDHTHIDLVSDPVAEFEQEVQRQIDENVKFAIDTSFLIEETHQEAFLPGYIKAINK